MTAIARGLRALVGADTVPEGVPARYLADETESRGLRGHADALALPRAAEQVAEVVAWCYERDVPIVPRGGGTGYAGGAVPLGGVVLSLERLDAVRTFEPLLWRMHVEAGVTTARARSIARESGLFYPPDPGAAEQSQIGGNVATNAGGPHAFKYGVTGAWVTGLEAVVAPGELVSIGGPIRKDAAGYDVKSLLVGSEGTLGVITAVWLRLVPTPEAVAPVVSFHDGTEAGCAAIERVLGHGLAVAALEYLDAATVRLAAPSWSTPANGAFMVVAEVDGSQDEVARLRAELLDVLGEDALSVHALETPAEIEELWRWRDGVSLSVRAARGGKAGEDIVVPLEHLAEAIEETAAIGRRHDLPACSWGHAGDGNLHANFLLSPEDSAERERANRACLELFELAVRLGGSISGEHGLGLVKAGQLERQWPAAAVALQASVKRAFDPKGLFNPGKKT